MITIINQILCSIGLHKWEYFKKPFKIGFRIFDMVKITIVQQDRRKCTCCNEIQYKARKSGLWTKIKI